MSLNDCAMIAHAPELHSLRYARGESVAQTPIGDPDDDEWDDDVDDEDDDESDDDDDEEPMQLQPRAL